MMNRILIALTTVVVSVAAILFIDRAMGYAFSVGVTLPMIIYHYATRSAFAIIIVHLTRNKTKLWHALLFAFLYSFVTSIPKTLMGFPPDGLPDGAFLHDLTFVLLIMVVYARLNPHVEPPTDQPT